MNLRITRERELGELIGPRVWIPLCTLLLLAGCGGPQGDQRRKDNAEFTVIPFSNSSALALDGKDVHHIMEIAGFTPPQIWQLAEDLHNALMQLGGAKMRMGKKQIEVIYAVQGDLVWITTRSRGLFVYDTKSKQFNLGPGAHTGSPSQSQAQAL